MMEVWKIKAWFPNDRAAKKTLEHLCSMLGEINKYFQATILWGLIIHQVR